MDFNKKILTTSILAGFSMILIQMLSEAIIPNGAGFWSPLIYTSSTLITSSLDLSFAFAPVLLGLAILMFNSVVIGVVYEILIEKIKSMNEQIVVSIIFVLCLTSLMWFVILPAINPVMLYLNSYVFFISHVIWVGILFSLLQKPKK